MQKEKEWELAIDPDTVRMFVLKARAFGAGVADDYRSGAEHEVELDNQSRDSHHHDGLAEEEEENLTAEELRELIDDLNVDEAAELIVQAGALSDGGEIFLLEMGQPVKIRDLAENMRDCDPAPKNFQLPDLGIPGLGSSSSQLQSTFGMASMGGAIAYRADAPGADALGTANNAQYIGYLMSGGRVAAFGAGETSVPAAPKSD